MTGNLKAHRDGSTQQDCQTSGCPGRMNAAENGHVVPPSVAELQAQNRAEAKKSGGPLDSFVTTVPKTKFDNLTFNQAMCIWLVRQSLPWARVADPWLRAAVQYLRPEARLFGRHWAALEAKRLNLSLKEQVFSELKVSSGFLCVGHRTFCPSS